MPRPRTRQRRQSRRHGATAKTKLSPVTIATGSFVAEPGSAQKVTLKLNAVGQALLASERKLTATVSLTAAGKLLQRVSVPLTAPKISATNTHGLGSLARLRLAVPRFAS